MSAPPNALADGDQRVRPLAGRDVAGDALGPDAVLSRDALRLVVEALGAPRREDEIDALGRESFRDRKADAEAAAGHYGDLALQSEIHVLSFHQQV